MTKVRGDEGYLCVIFCSLLEPGKPVMLCMAAGRQGGRAEWA